MKLKLVSLFVLVASSVTWGQEIYFHRTTPIGSISGSIARMNSDGSNPTTVFTMEELGAALDAIIPGAVDSSLDDQHGAMTVDSLSGKMYLTVRYTDTSTNFRLPAIVKCNLDGSDFELVLTVPAVIENESERFRYIQFARPSTVPAVSGVGLAILVATLIAGGGWIISRRTGMKVSTGE